MQSSLKNYIQHPQHYFS